VSKQCPGKATLLITKMVAGTSTSIARDRILLQCSLLEGHTGPHLDSSRGEHWQTEGDRPATLLRQEEPDE
jgi:hypothetical protein